MKKWQRVAFWTGLALVCVVLTVVGWGQTASGDPNYDQYARDFSTEEEMLEHIQNKDLLVFDPAGFGFDSQQLTLNYEYGYPDDPSRWLYVDMDYEYFHRNERARWIHIRAYFGEDMETYGPGYQYSEVYTMEVQGVSVLRADIDPDFSRVWFVWKGFTYEVTLTDEEDPAGMDRYLERFMFSCAEEDVYK